MKGEQGAVAQRLVRYAQVPEFVVDRVVPQQEYRQEHEYR